MDFIHAVLAIGLFLEAGMLAWGLVQIVWSLDSIERSQEKIAEMANRTERMTLDVLQKIYDVKTPSA